MVSPLLTPIHTVQPFCWANQDVPSQNQPDTFRVIIAAASASSMIPMIHMSKGARKVTGVYTLKSECGTLLSLRLSRWTSV